MESKKLYKVSFINQDKVYEIFAKQVYESDLYGFVVIEELVFGSQSDIVIDPSEEKLQIELKRYSHELTTRNYAIAISKIDVVESENIAKDFMDNSIYDAKDFIEKDNGYFLKEQEDWSGQVENKNKLPNFILPISSVINQGLDELKYALYDAVEHIKK